MNQLSYVVNVLGKNGPMALEDDGRALVLDLSAQHRSIPGSKEMLPASLQESPESGRSAVSEKAP